MVGVSSVGGGDPRFNDRLLDGREGNNPRALSYTRLQGIRLLMIIWPGTRGGIFAGMEDILATVTRKSRARGPAVYRSICESFLLETIETTISTSLAQLG